MKNENEQHPLKKNIKDLTPADLAALEKPLGTSDRPFPMWGSQRVEHNGRADLEQVLSVIADDTYPMKVYSERAYKEVVAMAYCDMPVPSMLPLFKDGLERRAPESTNRTQMMIGNPGHGKSFLGALQGRLRQKGPVEIYDCGGKNMNDLLFEMVLDFGSGDALPRAIDKRLQAGTLEPLSIGLLKGLPSEVVTADDAGNVKSIDWNALKSVGTDKVEAAFEVLKKVSKTEGLDNAGGNALGMNSQYGALIRWFIEKREGVLDEYNKSREGSDNALQTVWQFLIGELKEVTVENPLKNKDATSGPSSFTFRKEDMGAGFFITLTGNKTEDGVTTRSLNKSVYSRLSPQTLPDPDVIDWQHRICQMMVGLPVSTLYTTFREQADKDPDAFGEWLMWLRRTKAEVEGVPVPELQETLISNWKNVVNSSEKLAKFYDKWAKMTDAEKITSNGHADLVEEVDEEYAKKEGIDFRKIKQHLEEAIPIKPRMQKEDAPRALSLNSWDKAPKLGEPVVENPSLNFGTRLTEFLERMVYEKTGAVGKPRLYEKLTKSMQEFALRDITLQEAARSKQRSVEEDLNISAFNDRDLNKQAAMARKIFCEYLRQSNPDITASDDEIVTPKTFRTALEAIAAKTDAAANNELFVANRDPESLYAGKPLTSAVIKDAAIYVVQKKDIDFGFEDLVHHDDLLASLALPTVGAKNLSAVWEQNIRPLTRGDAANDSAPAPAAAAAAPSGTGAILDHDEALYIAENKSEKKIATTSIQALYADEQGERPVSLHIVRNETRNKTLIVSEKAPSKLLSAFKEAGVIHVDRHDPNAQAKVEAALADITRGMPASVKDRLVDAFKYRNDTDLPHLKGKTPQLSELLVDDKIDMLFAKYVVKNDKKKAAGL
jgi:hypothetical protein